MEELYQELWDAWTTIQGTTDKGGRFQDSIEFWVLTPSLRPHWEKWLVEVNHPQIALFQVSDIVKHILVYPDRMDVDVECICIRMNVHT